MKIYRGRRNHTKDARFRLQKCFEGTFWAKFGKFNLSEDKSIILRANIGSGGAWEGVKDKGSLREPSLRTRIGRSY